MDLPSDFIIQTQNLLGKEWDDFYASLATNPPISLRYNTKRTNDTSELEPVTWCSSGFYLSQKPSFTLDPLFHAGTYYVQEASSMFLEQIVRQKIQKPVVALDLCAAPGGKSTHLSSLLPENSLLISNELIHQRASILAENIQKWGSANNIVTNNNSADFGRLDSLFDMVLVDAPCSGEGMFRKNSNSIAEWSVANVEMCQARQRSILTEVWDALKEDGWLIYSTCTYNRHENEENIIWITEHLGAEVVPIKVPEAWGVTENEYGYRFFPHKTKGEGFFISLLRKKSATKHTKIRKSEKTKQEKSKPFFDMLQNADNFTLWTQRNMFYAFPKHFEPYLNLLQNFNIMLAGIALAEQKGKDFIPQTGLALSKSLNAKNALKCDVELKTALAFLRKESFYINAPKGFILLTYQETPIGWGKNLGSRVNNLYPNEWRIRKTID